MFLLVLFGFFVGLGFFLKKKWEFFLKYLVLCIFVYLYWKNKQGEKAQNLHYQKVSRNSAAALYLFHTSQHHSWEKFCVKSAGVLFLSIKLFFILNSCQSIAQHKTNKNTKWECWWKNSIVRTANSSANPPLPQQWKAKYLFNCILHSLLK